MKRALIALAVVVLIGVIGALLDRDGGNLSRGEAEAAIREAVRDCPDFKGDVECRLRDRQWTCYYGDRSAVVWFPDPEDGHPEVSIIC